MTSALRPRVLNVGSSDRNIPIPAHYAGWDNVLLDIDARVQPDIVCDARELTLLPGAQFDAIYCSHNFEHYYPHDGRAVLRGFLHVLRSDGFAELRVPDLQSVMQRVIDSKLDIEDTLYMSAAGPITVRDVIFGYEREIEESGQDFYAHKTGFTDRSLYMILKQAGFGDIFVSVAATIFEVRAYAFKGSPTPRQRTLLKLPDSPS
jgi:ubiquinone/menaquinone biosynthesis C-methylase UbiE